MNVLALLALLAAFPPLTIDMYLPSFPILQEAWNVSYSEISRSLTIFMIAFSSFLLVHGPLSDRFGRKPVLKYGILLYILGTIMCAMSNSLQTFLIARALQGAGAAAASALSLAIAKDLFEGVQRQKILGYIGVLMTFCPMIAPTIGGAIIQFLSWRWIFILKIFVAIIALYGVSKIEEPLTEFTKGGVISVAKRYIVVFKNVRFTVLAIAFATVVLPHFGFIGGAAGMYMNGFGVSEQAFGLYFAFNAMGFMTGSFVCTQIGHLIKPMQNLIFSLCTIFTAGVTLHILGGTAPWTLALPMIFSSFAVGFSRPVGNSMILDQVNQDVGAASGLMTFLMFAVGAIAIEIISMDWPNKPVTLGSMAIVGALIPLITFVIFSKKGIIIQSSEK